MGCCRENKITAIECIFRGMTTFWQTIHIHGCNPRKAALRRICLQLFSENRVNHRPFSLATTRMSGLNQPPPQHDYSNWSTSNFIARITELEQQLATQTAQNSSTQTHTAVKSKEEIPAKQKGESIRKSSPDEFSQERAPKRFKKTRDIDPSKYYTRFIALKFAYLGQNYNGYEHSNGNVTPLSTIEEEIYKAMRRCRLIFSPSSEDASNLDQKERSSFLPYTIDWTGCDYSKCGRTDRGVSAFGQVIGIRVRSSRPKRPEGVKTENSAQQGDYPPKEPQSSCEKAQEQDDGWDDVADELPYIQMINGVLPPDIRMLAWCPHPPPDFNARFACRQRRYKYFFTQPAFSPTPGPLGFVNNGNNLREGWLDIEAMREAARLYIGTHDFRNLCKVDPSKQITNFVRHIFYADIEEIDPRTAPLSYLAHPEFQPHETGDAMQVDGRTIDKNSFPFKVYTFTVHGSAFLWHQVRHMVAILFLVGQGLEPPSIVTELFDIEKNPCRPTYELASDNPLVLWDCVFPDDNSESQEDALEWIYAGDQRAVSPRTAKGDGKFGVGGTVNGLWSVWRQRKIDELLAGSLLNLVANQGDRTAFDRGGFQSANPKLTKRNLKLFSGGNEGRLGGKYVPLMERRKVEPVEKINARYLEKTGKKKGFKQDTKEQDDGDE